MVRSAERKRTNASKEARRLFTPTLASEAGGLIQRSMSGTYLHKLALNYLRRVQGKEGIYEDVFLPVHGVEQRVDLWVSDHCYGIQLTNKHGAPRAIQDLYCPRCNHSHFVLIRISHPKHLLNDCVSKTIQSKYKRKLHQPNFAFVQNAKHYRSEKLAP